MAEYPKEQLMNRYAQEAGCKKEMCAYTGKDKLPPNKQS